MTISLKQPIPVLAGKARNHALGLMRKFSPKELRQRWCDDRMRRAVERRLADLVQDRERRFSGRVLIDGMFDNPNYWLRLSLFRAALGLAGGDEVGLLGPYNRRHVAASFKTLGVEKTIDLVAAERDLGSYRQRARALLAAIRDPAEILGWDLPHGVPGSYLYDALLRRQRAVSVDLDHYKIEIHIADALRSFQAAGDVVARGAFDLVVLSHHIDTRFSALAYAAIARGIPVIVLYGNLGQIKFVRFAHGDDTFRFTDSPSGRDLDGVPEDKAAVLRHIGERYLTEYRWAGRTKDLGAIYAFQGSQRGVILRDSIADCFKWDAKRPIVTVYLSNGWDNIHGLGMDNFRDLEDWLLTTLDVAARTTDVNWLFRGHPVDQWYHGANLLDKIPADTLPHVRICDTAWNNSDVLNASDAMITYHGTAGVEFAAMGKPVLLADRGWYHDCGFAKWSKSRDEYLANLATIWWKDMDLAANRERALLFSGLYFCSPEWQGQFVLGDDSRRQSLYGEMAELLDANSSALNREIEGIWRWFQENGAANYHTWTMLGAARFAISNVTN